MLCFATGPCAVAGVYPGRWLGSAASPHDSQPGQRATEHFTLIILTAPPEVFSTHITACYRLCALEQAEGEEEGAAGWASIFLVLHSP